MKDNLISLLFVTTNDAWFGEEGCAEQHAAHSVIRALEQVCLSLDAEMPGGRGGFPANGVPREIILNEQDSVYFKGASILEITVGKRVQTFYAENNNYFIVLCCVFVILTILLAKKLTYKIQLNE